MPNIPNLTVIVRNRDKILFNGQAYAVTTINDKGIFDILPQHENFITLIKEKVIVRKTPTENQEIQIDNGIARVFKDKVFVYVNVK